MSPQTIGLIIGGLIPALLFSVSNLAVKASTQQGIGTSYYVMIVGIGVFCVGVLTFFFFPERGLSVRSGAFAFSSGVFWATGVFCLTYAINRYGSPIGQLTPLFNMNSLLTVLIALWIFAEWKEVRVPQLLLGTIFIVIGGIFVAKA